MFDDQQRWRVRGHGYFIGPELVAHVIGPGLVRSRGYPKSYRTGGIGLAAQAQIAAGSGKQVYVDARKRRLVLSFQKDGQCPAAGGHAKGIGAAGGNGEHFRQELAAKNVGPEPVALVCRQNKRHIAVFIGSFNDSQVTAGFIEQVDPDPASGTPAWVT